MGFMDQHKAAKADQAAQDFERLDVQDVLKGIQSSKSMGFGKMLDTSTAAIVEAINTNTKAQLLVLRELRQRTR